MRCQSILILVLVVISSHLLCLRAGQDHDSVSSNDDHHQEKSKESTATESNAGKGNSANDQDQNDVAGSNPPSAEPSQEAPLQSKKPVDSGKLLFEIDKRIRNLSLDSLNDILSYEADTKNGSKLNLLPYIVFDRLRLGDKIYKDIIKEHIGEVKGFLTMAKSKKTDSPTVSQTSVDKGALLVNVTEKIRLLSLDIIKDILSYNNDAAIAYALTSTLGWKDNLRVRQVIETNMDYFKTCLSREAVKKQKNSDNVAPPVPKIPQSTKGVNEDNDDDVQPLQHTAETTPGNNA